MNVELALDLAEELVEAGFAVDVSYFAPQAPSSGVARAAVTVYVKGKELGADAGAFRGYDVSDALAQLLDALDVRFAIAAPDGTSGFAFRVVER